jgi:hypothetical protein
MHGKIVTQTACDFGERVCWTRCDENEVCPSPEFDMQYRVANFVVRLYKAQFECDVGDNSGPHLPFVFVNPDARIGSTHSLGIEEVEGSLCGDNFNFNFIVLEVTFWSSLESLVSVRNRGQTRRSSATMSGALMDATLPVVMSRMWKWPTVRSLEAMNAGLVMVIGQAGFGRPIVSTNSQPVRGIECEVTACMGNAA